MRIAAAHPDRDARRATLEARLRIDGAFDAAARATALQPVPQVASQEGLQELLEATKAGQPLAFASEDQLSAAWDATWTTRGQAFHAMEQLREALHAAVVE